MKALKFKRKSIVVEAIQLIENNIPEITLFCGDRIKHYPPCMILEGIVGSIIGGVGVNIIVETNDWIVKDTEGNLYPLKPDVFERNYERVVEPTTNLAQRIFTEINFQRHRTGYDPSVVILNPISKTELKLEVQMDLLLNIYGCRVIASFDVEPSEIIVR